MSSPQGTSVGSEPRSRPPPGRRRDKPQLSCNLCRRRKLRCDRQQPCQTCTHRGLPCTYTGNGSPPSGASQHAIPPRPRQNVQARLAQLEQLVVSLVDDDSHARTAALPSGLLKRSPTASASSRSISEEIAAREASKHEPLQVSEGGSIRVDSSGSRYVGSNHWTSILDEIADLKDNLEAQEDAQQPDVQNDRMPLLYGCKPASRAEILASIPPKSVVDGYISYYFNALDLSSAAAHTGKFIREYEAFWKSPSETPVMWLGLLYSIMCMAVICSGTAPEDPRVLIDHYREKTAQCMLLGNYTRGGPYNFATIFQYVFIEVSSRKDATQDMGVLHGITMNLLLQMGYHRDPSRFPGISPFDGELRRRGWARALEGDLVMSLQSGMPRRIRDDHWDTAEPRNLHDTDFDEDTEELPPSRPETEVTAVLQLIARRQMVVAVGAAVDLATSARVQPYADVMAVDQQLRDAEARIPPPLRPRSMVASLTDPPILIIQRFYIALMFRVGRLMIHRKYLSLDVGGESFGYSRKACLDACLELLQIQRTVDEEAAPGRVLHSAGIKMTSLATHGFLTACMTLCLVVHQGIRTPGNEHALAREEEIKDALIKSLAVWKQRQSSSKEACTAAKSVRVVLKKAGWLEDLETPNWSPAQGHTPGFDNFRGDFGAENGNFGGMASTMLGDDLGAEGLPWFMDDLGGGDLVGDAQAMFGDQMMLGQ